ncbi:hypothetical protein BC827DRAFT_1378765 [Russula dissimulans]|nr:hypothetical protein BC827DRAFT_1378765 [Russula dissimulans]
MNASQRSTADRGHPLRCSGADTKNRDLDNLNSRTRSASSSQRAKPSGEFLIKYLKGEEKSMNTIIISAGAISLSIVYCIMNTMRNIQATQQNGCSQGLYAALRLYKSQMTSFSTMGPLETPATSSWSSSQASSCSIPDSLSSRIVRMNMYWVTGLIFSISAVFLAIVGKQTIRDHRSTLEHQRDARAPKRARAPNRDYSLAAGDLEAWSVFAATDAMYRLFQVSLVIFFLGHVDKLVTPIGVPAFAPVAIFGILYVLGVIGHRFTPAP